MFLAQKCWYKTSHIWLLHKLKLTLSSANVLIWQLFHCTNLICFNTFLHLSAGTHNVILDLSSINSKKRHHPESSGMLFSKFIISPSYLGEILNNERSFDLEIRFYISAICHLFKVHKWYLLFLILRLLLSQCW